MPDNDYENKPPYYDIEIDILKNADTFKPQEELLNLLRILRPDWNVEKLKFKIFTNGITNKIFRVSCDPFQDRLVFRVFGHGSSKIINRVQELENFDKLSRWGIGAPVICRFRNGIVCGYLEGECVDVDTVRQANMVEKIAAALAKMHKIPPKTKSAEFTPFMYSKISNYFEVIPEKYTESNKQETYDEYFKNNGIDLKTDFCELQQKLDMLDEDSRRIVFCHNDLLIYNILYDPKTDEIHFIDYEYAADNFQLFDIANHFCEYAGVTDPDYSLCPDETHKRMFLTKYLHRFHNGSEEAPGVEAVDKLLADIPIFEAASHLFWSIWALAQSHLSVIDFDYLKYAIIRHKEYIKIIRPSCRNIPTE
ncbi:choline/ethanolamine kinase domain-containing protein [Ditylenchus destructor]|uniref:ethanolamine kinase n=1 Tax=Ditylenchus destructor TaxID=166010 RepID=A0AAD4NEC7_9BILA|nr:choline/ethanolamine kinase domain-containing protein [Ditylenchus destructor]